MNPEGREFHSDPRIDHLSPPDRAHMIILLYLGEIANDRVIDPKWPVTKEEIVSAQRIALNPDL